MPFHLGQRVHHTATATAGTIVDILADGRLVVWPDGWAHPPVPFGPGAPGEALPAHLFHAAPADPTPDLGAPAPGCQPAPAG